MVSGTCVDTGEVAFPGRPPSPQFFGARLMASPDHRHEQQDLSIPNTR